MVLLVAAVSFIAKNLTTFLIVKIFSNRYILISSTEAIVTLSLFFSFSSSGISFRSDAWTMENVSS